MDSDTKQQQRKPPRDTSFFNWIFFTWTIPLFRTGAKRDLLITDLDSPSKADESERATDALERAWNAELANAGVDFSVRDDCGKKESTKRKPSLKRAIIRTFWVPYTICGIVLFVLVVILQVVQPFFQQSIISYFTNSGTDKRLTKKEAYLQTLGLVLITFSIVVLMHHVVLSVLQIGMRIRVACCSLVYRKVLRLDLSTLSNTAAGQVVNLLSNDVSRFDIVVIWLHYLWIMPIQMTVIGYLMWQYVGVAALVGLAGVIVQTIPIQGYLSVASAKLRAMIAIKTDDRVQLMSELIAGIQVVKMYAWEKPFEQMVSCVRAAELKLIERASHVRAFYLSAISFSERLNVYGTLITFVLMGNTLTPASSFLLIALFNTIQLTSAYGFPQAIIMCGETGVSIRRLEEFLTLEEVKFMAHLETITSTGHADQNGETENERHDKVRIEMDRVAVNWVRGQLPPTLCNVSIAVQSQSLCGLVGSVGSGKSSLLHVILGELPVGFGTLSFFSGDVGDVFLNSRALRFSYSSQDPWLFSGSVRDNILFGQPYDKRRYDEVTRVCALLRDFEQLPHGDLSSVGERGRSLSGGQRARVNLARAVYRDADVYLLDDPLSAVDARVGRHLFEECIKKYLRGKTRILVTHQLQFLQQVDTVVILDQGMVIGQGTFDKLAKSELSFLKTLEEDKSEKDEDTMKDETEDNDNGSERKLSTEISCTSNGKEMDVDDAAERRDSNAEAIETGRLSSKVYAAYIAASGSIVSSIFLVICYVAGQVSTSGVDYWVSYWTNQQMTKTRLMSAVSNASNNDTMNDSFWYDEYGLFQTEAAVCIYTITVLTCTVLVIFRNILFAWANMNSCRNIHNWMFSNLLLAKMRFFNTNPSGRILNRFSKDVGAMDELLPKALLEAMQIFLMMFGVIVMVIIANYWMAIPTVVISCIFYVIRTYYLKTAQSVKRLEGVAKSPVFSHVESTLYGLITIRSRGSAMAETLRKTFDRYQDTHTAAWYANLASAAGFGFLLDIFSCIFIGCNCILFIVTDDGTTSGSTVGLAISQSLVLTGVLQYAVRQSAEIVSQMTSVERLLQYTRLLKEGPFTLPKPLPVTWPSAGSLKFTGVNMKYSEGDPPVLKDLNIVILPGWKVGIVGRTGAGKSSLITALFRLVDDGLTGVIDIDGVDTKSIGLDDLRPKISIIPQEPVLFSATLRFNLDPFDQFSDTQLWECLREVELSNAIPSLNYQVAGGGANFSTGQRQLICLARAILRNNRILVLDEATANIDPHTDALIQKTIRQRFADCTVLTIAHRLNTIMDSDRVLVMDQGSMMEFDHPHVLLQNREGLFSQMVQQTGKSMAENLAAIAEEAYKASNQFRILSENVTNTNIENGSRL